jgi:hypothetical protein
MSSATAAKKSQVDSKEFLAKIGEGRKAVVISKKRTVFSRGDAAAVRVSVSVLLVRHHRYSALRATCRPSIAWHSLVVIHGVQGTKPCPRAERVSYEVRRPHLVRSHSGWRSVVSFRRRLRHSANCSSTYSGTPARVQTVAQYRTEVEFAAQAAGFYSVERMQQAQTPAPCPSPHRR